MLRTTFASALLCMTFAAGAADYRAGEPATFGTYSRAYQDRAQLARWKTLCRGGGRYLAMSEAYEAGKPDPCNPKAKNWVR